MSSGQSSDEVRFRYDAARAGEIETKWQAFWEERGTFVTPNPGEPGFDASKPKYYCLDMFPYPSGAGLHVGHPEGYTASDIVSRFMRMKGSNVLHPMGWDAFGLPAEQYAIQTGVHPAITTQKAITEFRRQLKRFGFSYDWSREVATIDPEYYRWTQWIFLRLYESWFDAGAESPAHPDGRGRRGCARPISELVARLERGENVAGVEGGAWSGMSAGARRGVIDAHRLAYLGEITVNWCPALGTVLANDEVIDGRSERGGHPVLRKPLKQWQLRITAYAERLLEDLDLLDWPDATKTMQREWIGKSEGAEIEFEWAGIGQRAPGIGEDRLRVFTTRPDTIFGATYLVVAPEHELVERVLREAGTDVAALRAYVQAAKNRSDVDRQAEGKEKTGVFTGVYALNPATGEKIPVWTADYVLMGYGTGAIMGVPAHDERDFAFATTFGLPVVEVVRGAGKAGADPRCFTGEGVAVNSASGELTLDGLATREAKKRVIAWLEKTGRGARRVNYRLRDWTFSRQRYWGEPFPMVYDEEGRPAPVGEGALPVVLPELADYSPSVSDDPRPTLAKAAGWVRTTAGEAGVPGMAPGSMVERETNTMPGSAGSSWYFLRYCDPKNGERLVSREAEGYWMGGREGTEDTARRAVVPKGVGGVDLYIGGSEHAVGHLLYSRMWLKVLFDLGEVSTPEPFQRLFHQGMITSYAYQRADKTLVPVDEVEESGEGVFVERATGARLTPIVAKMSKSLKNVVNPDEIIEQFGADTFRLYEMYMGPLEASKPWNTKDTVGLFRFLQRAWRLSVDEQTGALRLAEKADEAIERQLHRVIAKVEQDIPRLAFNTAIATLIEFVNLASAGGRLGTLTRSQLERFALVLAPLAPHIAEELWSKLGHTESLAYEAWPAHDPKMLIDDRVEVPVSINGKVKERITVAAGLDKAAFEAAAMADPKVVALLAGKTPTKVIAVPGKMLNLVVG